MPNLKMKNVKSGVRFELVDDESETTVHLLPEDDQETLCRKLRRILAMVEPKHVVLEDPPPAVVMDRHYVTSTVPQSGNGWKQYAKKPEVPEHLKGEVEIIEEGE